MMAISGLLKPCYVYAPNVLLRRIGLAIARDAAPRTDVRLPWGATLRVNPRETIGRELYRQNIFDIAVSEVAWRLLRSGDAAVDVGANIGYMTSLFAARVGETGRVDSFEPHPRIFAELERNVALLRARPDTAPVRLHALALGARNGSARLTEPAAFGVNEGTATVVQRSPHADGASGIDVRLARLDAVLGTERVALLKIDVEGAEAEVLGGAERLLAGKCIESVVYEAHDCEASPLHELLQRFGFCVFGIGYGLRGLDIKAGTGAPNVDRAWESPSYLATLRPERVLPRLARGGWHVLKGRR
jgi:FkbM family methyltransferase